MITVSRYAPATPVINTPSSHDCGVGVGTFCENSAAQRIDAMNCSQITWAIYSMEAAFG